MHKWKKISFISSFTAISILFNTNVIALDTSEEDYELKLLGKYIFFDKISSPSRMACVTCHDPETGGTGSVSGVNLHQVAITGANPHTVGGLRPPTNIYASFIQPFEVGSGFGPPPTGGARGGNFWDGRAEGRDGALFPAGATKHIGAEVFQGAVAGDTNDYILAYADYFGPTSDQALNPMPNPVEQNIERQAVCEHVAAAKYAELYEIAWGEPIDCSGASVTIIGGDVASEAEFDISFKRLMLAVGAWQHSSDLNSFSSKRDIALREELACIDPGGEFAEYFDQTVCDAEDQGNWGKFPLVGLTAQENLGHDLFYNTKPIPFAPSASEGGPSFNTIPFPGLALTNCSFCHSDDPGPVGPGLRDDGSEILQLYADDAYHNIGTPANPELPAPPNAGLANHTGAPAGFFKTPTLRNIDKRNDDDFIKAYGHNGWFKSLESIVHFYNTAAIGLPTANSFGVTRCPEDITTEKDALANNCWPEPEHGNVPAALVGNLGMSLEEEAALVAYMKTFTDTKTPKAPIPYKPANKK